MSTYKEAGVDIELGDAASRIAFNHAKSTFQERLGMIGEPLSEEGGFAGLLNFGDFYMTQSCDTVGTKIDLAEKIGDYSGLGNDLLAMVCDDAVCVGAEVVSITNTFETKKVETEKIDAMMKSLAKICKEQKIVIAGGEIAEVGDKIKGTSWGADAVGIVKKDKVIDTKNVEVGDAVIAIQENGLRCNGYSLVRKLLKDNFEEQSGEWRSLAKKALIGSTVYHNAIMALHGRYDEEAKVEIHGIAHITGGGIPGNLNRVLKKNNLGARLEDIFDPPEFVMQLKELGGVEDRECFKTWNMGNGMLVIVKHDDADKTVSILNESGVKAKRAGLVTKNPQIYVKNFNSLSKEKFLSFDL